MRQAASRPLCKPCTLDISQNGQQVIKLEVGTGQGGLVAQGSKQMEALKKVS